MRATIYILAMILLLVIADFAAERLPEPEPTHDRTPHPVVQRHATHGTVEAVPVWYSFMGTNTLYVCRDSAATLFGHRPLSEKQREAWENYQKPDTGQ